MWRSTVALGVLGACSFHGRGMDPSTVDDAAPVDDTITVLEGDPPPDTSCTTTSRTITFANGTRAELDDMPVLIALTDVPGDGLDLKFTDSDGTPLVHEIDHWVVGGTSYVWVKVPVIDDHSTTDHIELTYGGGPVPTTPLGGVWSDNFVAVWHFEDGAGGTYADSTTTPNPANAPASTPGKTPPTKTDGQIGNAVAFNGTSDRLDVAAEASLGLATMTIEAWVAVANPVPAGWGAIVEHGRLTNNWYGLWRSGETMDHFHWRWSNSSGTQTANFANEFDTTHWFYVVGTIDATAQTARTYQNGVIDHTTMPAGVGTASTQPLGIGGVSDPAGGERWKGSIDELRISKVVRSDDWISAQFASMKGTFATVNPPAPCL